MTTKFKLITEDEKLGVWIEEIDLLKIIKILKYRNKPLYKSIVKKYENLTEKKFSEGVLIHL